MNKYCSIFFYEGCIGVSPTIANMAKLLARNEYLVTLYCTENKYPASGELGNGVQEFYFRKGSNKLRFLKTIGLKTWLPFLQQVIYNLSCLWYEHKSDRHSKFINIGVDAYGLIPALFSFYVFKQKFMFLSLEFREPQKFNKILFNLAKLACRKAEAVIIQDEDRFETLCQDYDYRHPQVFYLPNSPLAENEESPDVDRGNYFREKFNLSQEQFPHIILQAGMIDDTVLAKPLARAFASLSNGCALVFHDRFPKSPDAPFLKSLRSINSTNLFISLEPVAYNKIDWIFSSATINLAFYNGHNDDYTKMAKASGKLSHSLKVGKPVLVNDLPGLRNLVEKYKCGLVIKDPSDSQEIQLAIEQIIRDYEMYEKNARLCFEAEFDFQKEMEPILSSMNYIIG